MATPCVIWAGHIRPRDGYGIHWSGRMAHRVVYGREVGPIPDGLELDHLCKNRACVNVEHLEPVTRKQNIDRGDNQFRMRTHCPRAHAYDDENTLISNGRRHCKTCRRDLRAARNLKRANCTRGHPFDRLASDGRRYCSVCQSEAGRTAMASRWGATSSHS